LNFNFIWLALLFASACGVKGAPRAPEKSTIPSIEEAHPDLQLPPGKIYPNKAP
jgi:hypothetical protein